MCKLSHFKAASHFILSPQIPCTCALPPWTLHCISPRKSKQALDKELPFLSISKRLSRLHQSRCFSSSVGEGTMPLERVRPLSDPSLLFLLEFVPFIMPVLSLLASWSACTHAHVLSLGTETQSHISFTQLTCFPAASLPPAVGLWPLPLSHAPLVRSMTQRNRIHCLSSVLCQKYLMWRLASQIISFSWVLCLCPKWETLSSFCCERFVNTVLYGTSCLSSESSFILCCCHFFWNKFLHSPGYPQTQYVV